MKHHTKNKGDLGVAKVISSLVEQEYDVFLPVTEHLPFDLIAYKDLKCYRVQVKARSSKKGCVEVKLKTSWADRNGTHEKQYDLKDIDVFAIYDLDEDSCYFVGVSELVGLKNFSIRTKRPKNNIYATKIRFYKDYLNMPS